MDTLKPGSSAVLAALLVTAPLLAQAAVKSRLYGYQEAMAASRSPVGIEIYLQAWNPLMPEKDTPASALNQPSGISGSMNAAWDAARAWLSNPKNPNGIPALLSKGGLIAKGVNLYSVTLTTNSLAAITIQQGGERGYTVANNSGLNRFSGGDSAAPQADAFTVHWSIPGTRLDFRATTPDAVRGIGLSRDLDPKLSVQIDLDITLGFAVSDQAGQPALQVTETSVYMSNPQVDSGNFSGDVIKTITNFCTEVAYGKNLNTLLGWALGDKNLAADPQHGGLDLGGLQSVDLKKFVNEQLIPLNADIARSGVGNYLRVGLWAKKAGSNQMLALLFAPKALPMPPQNGTLSGSVQFDNTGDNSKLPANCSAVIGKDGVDIEVQTGPRKILGVDPFSYGSAPLVRLRNVTFGGGPVANRECAFTLTGLVDAWPNNISFPAPTIATRGSLGNVGHYLQLKPDNWTSPLTLTAVSANGAAILANHNLLATGSMAYNDGVGAQRKPGLAGGLVNPGDPAYNPAAAAAGWSARQRPGAAAVSATTGAWGARQASGAVPAAAGAWNAPAAGAAGGSTVHSNLAPSHLRSSVATASKAAQPSAPAAPQQIEDAPH